MTPAERSRRLAELLAQSSRQYDRLNDRQVRYAIREIDRTRLELNDLLADYATKDGTISRSRINTLLRDLDEIEAAIRRDGMSAMRTVITDSAKYGMTASNKALLDVIGRDAGVGVNFDRLNREVFRYVSTRFEPDGLVLSDRIWQLAGEQRDELNTVIRSGIIRGESVNTMTAAVRKVYANETWKIARLVRTEGNIAYRTGSSYIAQRSDYVKGLRIHRGEADRPDHMCTILSEEDRYGLGEGVYPVDNTEILHPHPNCTSYLTYELYDYGEV